MKIMHVIDSAGIYGAEVMLLNLMEEQTRLGLSPLLCSIEPQDHPGETSLAKTATQRGLNAIRYDAKRGYSWATAKGIIRLADERSISLIHSHGYKGNILLGSIPRFMRKIPVISTIHGRTSIRKFTKIWFYDKLDDFFLNKMDAIVSVSPAMQTKACETQFIVENGISPLKFDPQFVANSDPTLTRFCKEGFIIGTISRLSEEKGMADLIEAVYLLSKKDSNIKAVIIGDGELKKTLQKLILDKDLSGKILLAGYKANAYHYLPLFDLFVLPSLTEGLPITILEAMQSGIPIVATRVGGIPEVLGGGLFGHLVDPGNPRLLAEEISRICSDMDTAWRMAKDAKNKALTDYSIKKMAEKYSNVYEKVLMKWQH